MGSAENSHSMCNTKLSLQRPPNHVTSTKSFKNFGPWPTELCLPAVRTKCSNIPRGMHHHHLSLLLCSPSRELNLSLHCCAPQLTEGWRNCHCLQVCQETVSMRTGVSLSAHSSPKKGAPSWWGGFLLSSHWQRRSIPGQHFKDKAALQAQYHVQCMIFKAAKESARMSRHMTQNFQSTI